MINIEVIDMDALPKIKAAIEINKHKYLNDEDYWLEDYLHRENFPTYPSNIDLDIPILNNSENDKSKMDVLNAIALHKAIKIAPELAGNGAFWTILSHHYIPFLRKRLELKNDTHFKQKVTGNLVFNKTMTKRERRTGYLPRLWSIAELTFDPENTGNEYWLTEIAFRDQDIVNNLLDRNVFMNKNITKTFLRHYAQRIEINPMSRGELRALYIYLKARGDSIVLESLSVEEIDTEISTFEKWYAKNSRTPSDLPIHHRRPTTTNVMYLAAISLRWVMPEKYAVGSMFAGIGGICLGFQNAGAKVVWANEIDRYACETYRFNFNGAEYLQEGDIHEINPDSSLRFDVLAAGFPCQAFSVAGYRKGFEDTRGTLFFEVLRIIKDKKPRAVFLENVKNLMTHDKGNTYKVIKSCLEEEGYCVKEAILNTMMYGNIPQNRERIYIVAFKLSENGFSPEMSSFAFPTSIPLTVGIRDIINFHEKMADSLYYPENHPYYKKLDEKMINLNTVYQWRRTYTRENKSNVCPTLTANMGMGGHNVPIIRDDYGIRKLSPEECLRLQGFPENFRFPDMPNSHKYKQAGNSVSVPVVERIATNMIFAMHVADNDKDGVRFSEPPDSGKIPETAK